MLEAKRRTFLRDDITTVPVGGLDKLATFVALLRGNELEIVVLHDFGTKEDKRLEALVEHKMIRERQIMNYAQFRSGAPTSKKEKANELISSDIEDLFSIPLYLRLFNATFADRLNGHEVKESDLPPGNRIIDRINRHLKSQEISLKASGDFNHYTVANYLAAHPLNADEVDEETLAAFERVMQAVNGAFGQ